MTLEEKIFWLEAALLILEAVAGLAFVWCAFVSHGIERAVWIIAIYVSSMEGMLRRRGFGK